MESALTHILEAARKSIRGPVERFVSAVPIVCVEYTGDNGTVRWAGYTHPYAKEPHIDHLKSFCQGIRDRIASKPLEGTVYVNLHYWPGQHTLASIAIDTKTEETHICNFDHSLEWK